MRYALVKETRRIGTIVHKYEFYDFISRLRVVTEEQLQDLDWCIHGVPQSYGPLPEEVVIELSNRNGMAYFRRNTTDDVLLYKHSRVHLRGEDALKKFHTLNIEISLSGEFVEEYKMRNWTTWVVEYEPIQTPVPFVTPEEYLKTFPKLHAKYSSVTLEVFEEIFDKKSRRLRQHRENLWKFKRRVLKKVKSHDGESIELKQLEELEDGYKKLSDEHFDLCMYGQVFRERLWES